MVCRGGGAAHSHVTMQGDSSGPKHDLLKKTRRFVSRQPHTGKKKREQRGARARATEASAWERSVRRTFTAFCRTPHLTKLGLGSSRSSVADLPLVLVVHLLSGVTKVLKSRFIHSPH